MGKKLMLRCIALLLVLATLSVLVISCGSKDDDGKDDGKKNETNSGNEGGNEGGGGITEEDIMAHIPATDMDGYTFEALARVTEWFSNEVTAEPDTGDQVLQAIYDRNWAVENRYNCVLTQTLIGENEWTTWKNSVGAGESIYKVGLNHMMQVATEALNGTMLNLTELPKIKLDAEWWNQSMNKELLIDGKLYFTANEYCTSSVYFTWLMIFNMELCEEKEIDVYGMIDNGTWTIDNFYEIVSGAYGDNGDKIVGVEDSYGLLTHDNTVLTNYIFAFEIPVTTLKADGKSVEVNFNEATTPMISATEKVYDLLYNSANGTLIMTDALNKEHYSGLLHDDAVATKFATNTALFANIRILGLETLRSADVSYGITPFPKFTEDQKDYHSHVDGRASLLFVPYTLPEAEYDTVGTLLEALAIQSQEIIMPVIQKAALLGRYSEDAEAYKCLEMTMDGRTYAFAYVFDSVLKTTHPYWSIVNIMKQKSNNFSNYWTSKSRTAAREINNAINKYINVHSKG